MPGVFCPTTPKKVPTMTWTRQPHPGIVNFMIKRLLRNLIRVCWCLCLTCPLAAKAQQYGSYLYTNDNGSITITGFTGVRGVIRIPATINDLPVRTVGDSAFSHNTILTNVSIPDSVTKIGDYAFANCNGLTNVTFGAGLKEIGKDAFFWCPSLTNITFPDSLTSIGQEAFGCCFYLNSIVIPDSVTNISDGAFYYCGLTNATLGNGITRIQSQVLAFCEQLQMIEIPSSVLSIGEAAFEDCFGLRNITIPNSVTNIDNMAFCLAGLTNVTIPGGVKSIGGQAFYYCWNLKEITISSGVEAIAGYAFGNCMNLTKITIPSSVNAIGDFAFANCPNLKAIYMLGNAPSANSNLCNLGGGTIVYYLPGTMGWDTTFGGSPTSLWTPETSSLGVAANRFGFNVIWASDRIVIIESCTNLVNPVWTPVSTNTLTDGTSQFGDPGWTNSTSRFYRVRSP